MGEKSHGEQCLLPFRTDTQGGIMPGKLTKIFFNSNNYVKDYNIKLMDFMLSVHPQKAS